MLNEHCEVVLERTQIIGHLFLEKFALCDSGYYPTNKELPEGHYCIYYRVWNDISYQYLIDWSSSISNDLLKLITVLSSEVNNK